jgi:hypothetical protein
MIAGLSFIAKTPLTPTLSPREEGPSCGALIEEKRNSGVPSPLGEKDRMRGSLS